MKKIGVFLLAMLPLFAFANIVEAENECHSGGTSWDGKPKSCDGEVCISAYRIKEVSAVVTKTNGYGTVSDCYQAERRDSEEEDGGWNRRVTKMCARFHARSPSGMNHQGERGTVRCKLSAEVRDN